MKNEIVFEFYIHKKSRDLYAVIGGSWNAHKGQPLVMYSHVGQHSNGSIEYVKESRLAYTDEYKDLLNELVGIYNDYDVIHVLNTKTIECYRNPTQSEIKFGEDALHWRNFTPYEIGLNRKGDLKNRFKADDGLWYKRI